MPTLEFNQHWDQLLILPALIFTQGECENPHCGEVHTMLSFGWVFWSVTIGF